MTPKVLLSLTTVPLLIGIKVLENIGENLIELGKASEEIFRGDRLPVLEVREQEDRTELSGNS
jgi:hypothetical protein